MVLKVYKELTSKLDMKSIGNEFIADSEHRQKIFGKFTSCILSLFVLSILKSSK